MKFNFERTRGTIAVPYKESNYKSKASIGSLKHTPKLIISVEPFERITNTKIINITKTN